MRFITRMKCAAGLLAVLGLGAGCGGIAATPAFSPLMFLLPGLAQNGKPAQPVAVPARLSPDGAVQVMAQAD